MTQLAFLTIVTVSVCFVLLSPFAQPSVSLAVGLSLRFAEPLDGEGGYCAAASTTENGTVVLLLLLRLLPPLSKYYVLLTATNYHSVVG